MSTCAVILWETFFGIGRRSLGQPGNTAVIREFCALRIRSPRRRFRHKSPPNPTVIERVNVVLLALLIEDRFQLGKLVRIFGRQVVAFTEILVEVI